MKVISAPHSQGKPLLPHSPKTCFAQTCQSGVHDEREDPKIDKRWLSRHLLAQPVVDPSVKMPTIQMAKSTSEHVG